MVYLDYAAGTPVSEKVLRAMEPYFVEKFFNPSAPYLPAKRVREEYEAAKDALAHVIGAKGTDLVMTSGATESINLAFTANSGKVLYLATEHDAVRNVAAQFPRDVIKVDKNGVIDLGDLRRKMTPEVAMVSVALANNELGTVQPLAKIAEIVRAERARRRAAGEELPIYLHSDASQALALLEINVARLGVDMLTLNAQKVYGPKGVGALWVSHEVRLAPVARGGGQERGLRSGTENVPGVVGFAAAAEEAKRHIAANRKKYEKLRGILKEELSKCEVEPVFLGDPKRQLANFCPVSFPGVDAERLIYKLEERGIYVSTGAACAASKGEKSHVLRAIGLSDEEIAGSLRISMGAQNTEEDIRKATKCICEEISNALSRAPVIQPVVTGESPIVFSQSRVPRGERKKIDPSINVSEISSPTPFGALSTSSRTVFVGMSGGVDSSVSAALLKEQGYHVVGAYMKNWSKDLPGMKCPWAEDLADAKRVATKLGIEFRVFDFEKEYKQKVVDYMLDEFRAGRTPNPDIMCNQEIKFKLFYEVAREQGADFIATGHYARTSGKEVASMPFRAPDRQPAVAGVGPLVPARKPVDPSIGKLATSSRSASSPSLMRAVDSNKDQTYFLYRISEKAIAHTIFPVGGMMKPEVKRLAGEMGLDVAGKKESMGVCFVGEVGMKEFLKEYVETAPGEIIDAESGAKLGAHDGAIFYTIGQRKGLNIGGGLPYYVVGKDMERNEVYVSKDLNNAGLWTDELKLRDVIMRGEFKDMKVRLRHRGELIPATFDGEVVRFVEKVRRPAAGQSAVFYGGEDYQICFGGGIIV